MMTHDGRNGPTPVFLLSLPRSGSTLLQRVLAGGEGVATASEPWLLLPIFYSLRSGAKAEFDHNLLQTGMKDFVAGLPDGKEDFYRAVRGYAGSLYGRRADEGCRYFVDKTPRYHFIVDELIAAFPEARFVFLWRHPLAVAASIMETWGDGRWNIYKFRRDLYGGLARLVAAYRLISDADSVVSVNYERFVREPEREYRRLVDELDLDGAPVSSPEFGDVELEGRLGDPFASSGAVGSIRADRLEKWKSTFCNPVRKRWGVRYLNWIGQERLSLMGYDLRVLLDELDALGSGFRMLGSDLLRRMYGALWWGPIRGRLLYGSDARSGEAGAPE